MKAFFDSGESRRETESSRVLHTPSRFAQESLWYVQEAGQLTSLVPHVCRREGLRSYLLTLVLSGEGTFTLYGKKQRMSQGSAALIDCMEPYAHISSAEKPWTLCWVHFYGRTVRPLYDYFLSANETPCFSLARVEGLEQGIFRLMELSRDANVQNELLANALLIELVTKIAVPAEAGETDKLFEVRQYLDTHYAGPVTLDGLAARFFISKFYLSRSFSARFGVTIGEYVQKKRITAGKELLRFTDLSVSEIAKKCGVPDASYFNKLFQRAEGVSPSGFRTRWRSAYPAQISR